MWSSRSSKGASAKRAQSRRWTFAMAFCRLWISGFLIAALPRAHSQLTWTPIYISDESQVDLWTQSNTGCPCNFNTTSKECACCVPRGGCSCGLSMQHRCVQCGLEKHCANMCNVTLDSKELFRQSGRGFGQIKSPSLEGPTVCTYKFIPDVGQRVELQIYRLVSVGHHNGKSCEGGWLQLEGGARVCGANVRFQQPVVLFSDKPEATLYMQVNQNTTRSQFLAYFSFASNSSTSVGWPVKNGKPVNNTECDWVYEDCLHEDCVLASPGYPGLYPPNSRCRYWITSETSVSITITFVSVLLSYNHCTNDYIAVYTGPTTSSTVLKTLCGNEKKEERRIEHAGSTLLVEFKSGNEVPPYEYNGFLARVRFTEITTEAPTTSTMASTTADLSPATYNGMSNNIRYENREHEARKMEDNAGAPSCDFEVSGDRARAGHHDTRRKLKSPTCRFVLRGRSNDTVHVALASYNLSAPECKSKIEIWEGVVENEASIPKSREPLKRICSPGESTGDRSPVKTDRYIESEHYSTAGPDMTVLLKRASDVPSDEEFMDVSYYFHDERHDGTQQPASVCDVEYYGLSSPSQGWVIHPEHRLFARQGPAKCKQHFIPAANQSVIVTIENSTRREFNVSCNTLCGDSGCRCVSTKSLEDENHLQLVSEGGHVVTCLCGNYQNWLPLSIRSSTPIYIEWSRSPRSPNGFNFQAAFKFTKDAYCGDYTSSKPEGIVNVVDLANGTSKLNNYYQKKCTWILESDTDRQLTVEVASMQDRPCTAWNLTIHEYKETGDRVGPRLHTFCSRDRHKNFTLPWKMNTAVVRLQALGRTSPQYMMKWRSDTVVANTRKSAPSPAPNYGSGSSAARECSLRHRAVATMAAVIVISSIDRFSTRSIRAL
ncbi:uncharacterized protein [Venturia canescens]|uniref:uncharacterized protein n=1 Tax=Venturia canescens TaxID=32260 RepID=UPI001C9D6234|nr:uncharacterized protein LOC122414158 [Venturia canescens]XP_043281029.1 uncharacterized protein LOC122414158 [Venturia canescens]XP_043281030.1 uncharacterized protein LOC122414158 [Venturia canescens]